MHSHIMLLMSQKKKTHDVVIIIPILNLNPQD